MLIDTPAAAAKLGATAITLNRWRCQGQGPNFYKIGRLVKYHTDDLDAWIQTRRVASTCDILS
jgi:predicted DNA-binding transcriptional regulator AlpA